MEKDLIKKYLHTYHYEFPEIGVGDDFLFKHYRKMFKANLIIDCAPLNPIVILLTYVKPSLHTTVSLSTKQYYKQNDRKQEQNVCTHCRRKTATWSFNMSYQYFGPYCFPFHFSMRQFIFKFYKWICFYFYR